MANKNKNQVTEEAMESTLDPTVVDTPNTTVPDEQPKTETSTPEVDSTIDQNQDEPTVSETPIPVPVPTPPKQVVVAFNHPHGIVFRLFKNGQEYKRVAVNGNTKSLKGKEKGVIPVGKFGYTPIDAEDWEEIKRQYGNLRIFKSGLIYAAQTLNNAQAEAEEKAELRHGLEPVDPASTETEEHEKE